MLRCRKHNSLGRSLAGERQKNPTAERRLCGATAFFLHGLPSTLDSQSQKTRHSSAFGQSAVGFSAQCEWLFVSVQRCDKLATSPSLTRRLTGKTHEQMLWLLLFLFKNLLFCYSDQVETGLFSRRTGFMRMVYQAMRSMVVFEKGERDPFKADLAVPWMHYIHPPIFNTELRVMGVNWSISQLSECGSSSLQGRFSFHLSLSIVQIFFNCTVAIICKCQQYMINTGQVILKDNGLSNNADAAGCGGCRRRLLLT